MAMQRATSLSVAALTPLDAGQSLRKAHWESRVHYNALIADPFLSKSFGASVAYFVDTDYQLMQVVNRKADRVKFEKVYNFPRLMSRQENVSVQVAGKGLVVYCDGHGTLHFLKAENDQEGAKWNLVYECAPWGVVPLLLLGAFYDEHSKHTHVVAAEPLSGNESDGAFRVSIIGVLPTAASEHGMEIDSGCVGLEHSSTGIAVVSDLPTYVSFSGLEVVLLVQGTHQLLVELVAKKKTETAVAEATSTTGKSSPHKRPHNEDALDDDEMAMLLSKLPRAGIGFHGEITEPKEPSELASIDFKTPLSERFHKSSTPFSSVDVPLHGAPDISARYRRESLGSQHDRPLEVPTAESILSGLRSSLLLVNLEQKVVQEHLDIDCMNFQFLCPGARANSSSDLKPTLLFRNDVHGLVFELNAAASKQEKKFMSFHPTGSLACIGELERRVFVYQGPWQGQGSSSDEEHKSHTRQQYVVELGDQQLLGLQIVNDDTILVLTSNHVYSLTLPMHRNDGYGALRHPQRSSCHPGRTHAAFEHAAQLSAVQLIPTHSFGGRSFSSTPATGLLNDDRIVAASPSEAVDQAMQAAEEALKLQVRAVDFASVSDLGYSLSDLAIRSLDVIHSTTGLPWWATIIATTVAVRTVFFPVTVISMRNAAKMKLFQPDMEKLRDQMDANPTQDADSAKEFQKKYKALMKKHDVNPFKSVLTPLSQIPVFLGFFWGLQDISKYFPEYAHEGIGWFPDLSAADPTMALPVISSALMVASVELGGDAMADDMKDKMKFGMRCFALMMVPLTMNFQSGIFVYWVTSNMFTLTQTALLRVNVVKRALNIPVTEVQRLEAATITTTSPFEAAVSRAKEGTVVKTHMYKPTKPLNKK
ncbi:Membrane insertase YidC/Oxa1, C-terminal [Phytophthora cactorum]|nr:Membrane insertase YidC/Oxa1, C-terminal [Phytophthora cactorum]